MSSFGISGTNAHAIIEQAGIEQAGEVAASSPPRRWSGPMPLLLSAMDPRALRAQASRLRSFVEASPELEILDVAATLAHRAVFDHRAVITGENRDDLLGGLAELAGIDDTPTEPGSLAAKGTTGVQGLVGQRPMLGSQASPKGDNETAGVHRPADHLDAVPTGPRG